MNGNGQLRERKRRDWTIILIILLFGFLCVIIAGEQAIRFSPTWKLDSNMRSNLDPDGIFLTNRPANYFQPLDPSILTQPTWVNVFLTPGIAYEPRTSAPVSVTISAPTNTPTSTFRTPTATQPSPTPTLPFFPPPTSTRRPPSITNTPTTPTATPPATAVPVDLSVTKTDGTATYTAGLTVIYAVVVANNGPNNVTGAVVGDAKPAQVTIWSWACASVVNAGGCDAVAGSAANFADTVDIQSGGSITYTVTAAIASSATGNLTNTASVGAPAGYTDTVPGNNSATDTDTPALIADLQITKDDGATHYIGDAVKTYTIVVTNAGPSNVTGATVVDTFSTNPNIASASWTCSASGSATCTPSGTGDINDTVNIPASGSITYLVTVQVVPNPSGSLDNTATVIEPPGVTDPAPGNNSDTDTDILIIEEPLPPNMGTKDNIYYTLVAPNTLTLRLSTDLVADGNTTDWDLVYYEYFLAPLPPPNSSYDGIWLDWIIIEISDGSNWYTVFNWGDNVSDTNTNVAHSRLTIPVTSPDPEEVDQRPVATGDLYGGSGVAIDIDSIVPPGTYIYIRFTAPLGDSDGQAEIDAIDILP